MQNATDAVILTPTELALAESLELPRPTPRTTRLTDRLEQVSVRPPARAAENMHPRNGGTAPAPLAKAVCFGNQNNRMGATSRVRLVRAESRQPPLAGRKRAAPATARRVSPATAHERGLENNILPTGH